MKQVYNLAGLMRKLKVDSFSELQERGYDVRSYLERRKQELYDVQSYLERRKQELTDELEAIIYGLQELDERDKEIARSQTQSELNEEFDNPYGGSTVYPYTRASSDDDDEDTPFSSPHASNTPPAMTTMRTLLLARHTPPAMTTMRTLLLARHKSPVGNMISIIMLLPVCQAILALTHAASIVILIISILGLKA